MLGIGIRALLRTPRLKSSYWLFAVAVATTSSLWALHYIKKGSRRIRFQHKLHIDQDHNDILKLRVIGPKDTDFEHAIEPDSVGKVLDACAGKRTVEASIASSATWSNECLHILGQSLSHLKDRPDLRLVVSLPHSDEIHPTCRDIKLRAPSISELQWSGHRFQLPMINPEITFSRIEKLELDCDLSMGDFAYLMAQGSETLRDVIVKTLIEDGSEDATFRVFPSRVLPAGSAAKTMAALEVLDIESIFGFASIMNCFIMPALKTFRFKVEHGDVDFSEFTSIVWRQLDNIDIHCDYDKSKLRSLKKSIYPSARFVIKRMEDRPTN